ncbi:hypothetical protein BV22DRAFT_101783 [Leucogyrophana mollusca]|uniref:Uncharacterized protein n=1 Tax=Leucogyrophana mollusca TaxID=85980 RepID=A0ACB8BW40_9AGAM|nr:hypothetical protein BV22DRAFT_101783 [Leucogyrophana mollusca]
MWFMEDRQSQLDFTTHMANLNNTASDNQPSNLVAVNAIMSNNPPPPLDDRLYELKPAAAAVFRSQTGIDDDDVLKKHILVVQAKAYKIFPYPCIRIFSFLRCVTTYSVDTAGALTAGDRLGVMNAPAYEQALKLGRERKDAVWLDIGCCFGADVRKAAFDGFPAASIVATDLHPGYWDLGHELFKSTPETFPAHFIAGDALDPSILSVAPPALAKPDSPHPQLSSLTSLNPLHGHVSTIYAGAFFHIFDEAQQLHLAQALAGLLSPEPGSVIFGAHLGLPEGKGILTQTSAYSTDLHIFCHSSDSWEALWDGEVFEKGSVKVSTNMKQYKDLPDSPWVLVWSVERL